MQVKMYFYKKTANTIYNVLWDFYKIPNLY